MIELRIPLIGTEENLREQKTFVHIKNLYITIYKNITHNSQNIDRSNQNVQQIDEWLN